MIFGLDDIATNRHVPVARSGHAMHQVSYTVRAIAFSGGNVPVKGRLCRPGSRGDFIRALEVLGTRLSKHDYQFKLHEQAIDDEQVALLHCPYETWVGVFGAPNNIEEPKTSPLFPVQIWRYDCTDGPIQCIGYQVNDLDGRRWVTFVRLCYF